MLFQWHNARHTCCLGLRIRIVARVIDSCKSDKRLGMYCSKNLTDYLTTTGMDKPGI